MVVVMGARRGKKHVLAAIVKNPLTLLSHSLLSPWARPDLKLDLVFTRREDRFLARSGHEGLVCIMMLTYTILKLLQFDPVEISVGWGSDGQRN